MTLKTESVVDMDGIKRKANFGLEVLMRKLSEKETRGKG